MNTNQSARDIVGTFGRLENALVRLDESAFARLDRLKSVAKAIEVLAQEHLRDEGTGAQIEALSYCIVELVEVVTDDLLQVQRDVDEASARLGASEVVAEDVSTPSARKSAKTVKAAMTAESEVTA